jgi:transposase-like protein
MVIGVRAGQSLREVAAQYGVSAPTVQRWVERAKGKRLARADFSDQPDVPHKVANRTSAEIERQALQLRRELKEQSDLGEFGAAAIHREMERRNLRPLPAVRTISYILQRYGALDYRVRQRNLPPPLGCGICQRSSRSWQNLINSISLRVWLSRMGRKLKS